MDDAGGAAIGPGGDEVPIDDGAVAPGADPAANPADGIDLGTDGEILTDPSVLGDAPPVVVTATGVPLPVLAPTDEGLLVRTPCGDDAEIIWGVALGPVEVVLDPGHGGDEPGARGPNGETEAEVNLDLARRTARELEALGITTALTRTSDYRITIPIRAAIADRLEAAAFVSIHHNSPHPDVVPERTGPGTEVYTQSGSDDSTRLGRLIHDRVVAALSVFDAEWASRTDAGVLTVIDDAGEDAYGIVRRPTVPSALIELAYLSNPTEALVIGTDEYRDAMAEALAIAIQEYLDAPDDGLSQVDGSRLFNPSAETGGSDGCLDPVLE